MEEKDYKYILKLFPAISRIQDTDLQKKVISTWHYTWKKSNFPRIESVHQFEPARQRIAYTNVEHTNQVCQACEDMASTISSLFSIPINKDELIAGSVLHDVDKMLIFDFETGGLSATGRKFSHAVLGATLAMMNGLSESIAHIIGAHSFRFSPTPPQTVEALILRHLDHVIASSYYFARGLDMDQVLNESMAIIQKK
jgi:putative nucleotidyltransferase with HDIG domain